EVRFRQGLKATHISGGSSMIGRPSSLTTSAGRRGLAWRIVLAALLLLSVAPKSWAGPAQDQLKGAIDRVVSTLESPPLKAQKKGPERRRGGPDDLGGELRLRRDRPPGLGPLLAAFDGAPAH